MREKPSLAEMVALSPRGCGSGHPSGRVRALPCLLPAPGALGGIRCRNERARRPRGCDSAGVEPCRGQGDRGLRAGLPPSAHAPSRAIPSLPRNNEGFSFSPSLRPLPPAGRGLPLQPASPLWHGRADPARVHMSRIHMHVSRRQQLPAGSGVRGAGWGWPPATFLLPVSPLPPSLHPCPHSRGARGYCRVRSGSCAWGASTGQKKFFLCPR